MGELCIQSRRLEEFISSAQVSRSPVEIIQELVENSIDAGSTNITVEDNGCGIEYDDAKFLCVRGHTSKNNTGQTLGYKGEALFSIKAVCASVEIQSKSQYSKGFILKLKEDSQVMMEGLSVQGTRMSLKDPFFNLPVRKMDWKKRRNSYASAILKSIKQLSLAFPVRFRLAFSWTSEFNFTSCASPNTSERIYRVLAVKASLNFEGSVENFDCECFLFADRPDLKFLYINSRYTSVGYRNLCSEYGHILFIRSNNSEYFASSSKGTSAGKSLLRPTDNAMSNWISEMVNQRNNGSSDVEPSSKTMKSVQIQECIQFSDIKPCSNFETNGEILHSCDIANATIVGQFNNGFIICQLEDKLMIIDQHAADERVFYEAFKEMKIHSSVQKLVVPKRIELEYEYRQSLEAHSSALKEYGFEFTHTDSGTFMTSAPFVSGTAFTEGDLKQLLSLESSGRGSLDQFFATRACKSAVKICQSLNEQTMQRILSQLSKTKNPWVHHIFSTDI